MDDAGIIGLYWKRSQRAIYETKVRYGRLIYSIAMNILSNAEDSEECESDTYLNAWNSMPPKRPGNLVAFLGKIARNLALDRYDREHALKRGGSQVPLILDELEECIPSRACGESGAELKDILDRFLDLQTPIQRELFVRRYWLGEGVKEIASRYGMGCSRVKMTLYRLRKALLDFLYKEGMEL